MSDTEKTNVQFSEREALLYHSEGRPGKIEIVASKPMATQRDLALAYSPGVAVPVQAIADDPAKAYDYTAKGNLVAVISNGTAILGMGNLGALASKPVMEGKAVLFKRFADVDSIDLEVATEDVDAFINCVALLEPSFGGINLEDIKAPECFIIEQTLRERMNIPVFHDDQHGTAIITAAGLINACLLTNRELKDVKVVVNGAGAAAIACTELIKAMGVRHDNVIMCDRSGVIYQGRADGMDQWKSAHAAQTDARDADRGAGRRRRVPGAVRRGRAPARDGQGHGQGADHLRDGQSRCRRSCPKEARAARPDAIIATGRSDYPNQVNNVLGFPFIFRGALDVRATEINDAMKIAAANAIAELARERVPEEVAAAYGVRHVFGPEYIIPAPFDPRLMEVVPAAVAQGGDGVGARDQADRGFRRLSRVAARAAQSDHFGADAGLRRRARRSPSGCCSPKAKRKSSCAPRSRSRKAATASRCWSGATMSTTGCARWASTGPRNTNCTTAAFRRWCRRWSSSSTNGFSAAAICAAKSSG